jgi:two-component system, response regulator PdtaR
VKLIVVSGKNNVDESHLPVGARFFSKPYNDSTIVEAMMGMLSGGNEQHL